MLVVGSRARPTARVPIEGVGEGFYVFRFAPPSTEIIPVAHMSVAEPNIACILAGRGRGLDRGYALHLVCEKGSASSNTGGEGLQL